MRSIMICILVLFSSVANAEEGKLFAYVPTDGEIQYYMNLYERLRAIESGKMDFRQLSGIFLGFEKKGSAVYETYQRLLFESYLRNSKNLYVRDFMTEFLGTQTTSDELVATLRRLYQGTAEPYISDSKKLTRYRIGDEQIDENINLFDMNESTVMNGEVGLMLFDNDWTIINLKPKNEGDPRQNSLVFGGGTNSISISVKATPEIDLETFKTKIVGNDFYQKKFESYSVQEIERTGVLARAGADSIFLGVGSGPDKAFPAIQNFSAIIFMYSEKRQTGYQIDYFMNISPKNNNYPIRDHLFNQLIFQAYMTYLN